MEWVWIWGSTLAFRLDAHQKDHRRRQKTLDMDKQQQQQQQQQKQQTHTRNIHPQ
ncbi:GD12567 [Drosophila simulans]|uniref:GD12567 n=1 Tax=Drosophila simulans TaxID=7240 RepID=B4QKL6_DROSI|nr:GD12567 [Drosophila simulans]